MSSRYWVTTDVRWIAVAMSLLLSLLHALLNPMPNVDAFTYVRTAEVFLDEGLFAAFAWYPSATYSVLIATIHQLSGLNLFVSGQMLNALFYALLTYVFISLVLEIGRAASTAQGENSRLGLMAAIIVLVFPQLNEYRYFMIRDIAALSLTLLGLLQLMRSGHNRSGGDSWWRYALLFGLCTLAAALFRPEMLVYLALGPMGLLLDNRVDWRERCKRTLQTLALVVGLSALVLVLGYAAGVDLAEVVQRAITVYEPFLSSTARSLDSVNSPISEAVFGEYAADYSGQYIALFVITGLSAILILKLITGFGLPALLLLLQGFRSGTVQQRNPAMRQAFLYALIAFFIMLAFLLLTRFLSTRYTLMFCTTLMLMMPFVVESLWQRAGRVRTLLLLILLYCAVDAHISFGDSKASVQEASNWLVVNSSDAQVVTNSAYLAYHSGRVAEYDQINRYIDEDSIRNAPAGALLAFSLDRDVQSLLDESLKLQQIELVHSFPEQGEPEFVIYRRLGD